MSRIGGCFSDLKRRHKKALIPYITAGDPSPAVTVELLHGLVAAGADILELGVPFSDPVAEGPIIQQACERALAGGTSLADVFAIVESFRQIDKETPLILMGYLNPVESVGYKNFARKAVAAGVDGIITVDMAVEEADDYVAVFAEEGLETIFLAAPNTQAERLEHIIKKTRGFLYYVSVKGVTGTKSVIVDGLAKPLATIRAQLDLPLAVGFGIKTAETAQQVAALSDAVVVGSALVEKIAAHAKSPAVMLAEVKQFMGALRKSIDSVPT